MGRRDEWQERVGACQLRTRVNGEQSKKKGERGRRKKDKTKELAMVWLGFSPPLFLFLGFFYLFISSVVGGERTPNNNKNNIVVVTLPSFLLPSFNKGAFFLWFFLIFVGSFTRGRRSQCQSLRAWFLRRVPHSDSPLLTLMPLPLPFAKHWLFHQLAAKVYRVA